MEPELCLGQICPTQKHGGVVWFSFYIGYDFMIDDKYNVWLIEVNSSPTMEYSTPVTKRLVQNMLTDTAKVVVDWRDAPKKVFFLLRKRNKLTPGAMN